MKILTDGTLENRSRKVQKRTYTDDLKKVMNDLQIVAVHFGHWGRVSAPVELEFKEIAADLIRILGNWDPKTQDSRYSCKLPIKAIRVLAGFEENDWHFNPRTACEPPEELLKLIWPWIEEELEKVFAANRNDGKSRITAVCVLRYWSTLRRIVLQDVAAMFVLHADRLDHPVMKLPVFHDPLFLQYVVTMRAALAADNPCD